MELRLVNRETNRELAFPFTNECMREKGSGAIAFDADKRPLIMQGHRIAMCSSANFSPVWENRVMNYLMLTDKEVGCCREYDWSSDEWNAFIVNDNGKTIDKL